MAFSTTKLTRDTRAGVIDCTITLLDTAGNSDAENFDGCDTITLHGEFTGTTPGTVTVQASNDGVGFYALPTSVTITADGTLKAVGADGLGFKFYRLNLAGASANAVWTVTVVGQRNTFVRGV